MESQEITPDEEEVVKPETKDDVPDWVEIPLEESDFTHAKMMWDQAQVLEKQQEELTSSIIQKTALLEQTKGALAMLELMGQQFLSSFDGKYGADGGTYEIDFDKKVLKRKQE